MVVRLDTCVPRVVTKDCSIVKDCSRLFKREESMVSWDAFGWNEEGCIKGCAVNSGEGDGGGLAVTEEEELTVPEEKFVSVCFEIES